jgi:ubiquinone/menaquinone biosynthesis C-methylase UbiE
MTRSEYLHGTFPEEQQRLSRLNDILNDASLAELRLGGGERILDLGSGLAQLTRLMARRAGEHGCVIGIERDSNQISEARRQAEAAGEADMIELRQGDVFALPLRDEEWGTFDIAHARFLLEHVSEPLAVVKAMVRAVRLGGRIVLEDDDHDLIRLWPEPAGFGPLWNAYTRVYDRLGNDPYVGRRLVSLIYEAGAQPARNTWIFFGSCAGNPYFDAYVDNMVGLFSSARDKIVPWGLLPASSFEEGVANLQAWKRRPEAAMWFAIAWAEAVRRL